MKKSQTQKVIEHLEVLGAITPREALNAYGIARLAGRIHELRRLGHRIESRTKLVYNRYGEKTWCAEYRLLEKGQVAGLTKARL